VEQDEVCHCRDQTPVPTKHDSTYLRRRLEQSSAGGLGALSDGKQLDYAYGLELRHYRGLPIIEHGGSTGGCRAETLRFPTLHTSFVALCNASNADPTTLMRRVADVVLASRFVDPLPAVSMRSAEATSVAPAVGVIVPRADLSRYGGTFYSDELDAVYLLGATDNGLVLRRARGPADTLQAVDARTFRGAGIILNFSADAATFTVDAGRVRGIAFRRR